MRPLLIGCLGVYGEDTVSVVAEDGAEPGFVDLCLMRIPPFQALYSTADLPDYECAQVQFGGGRRGDPTLHPLTGPGPARLREDVRI
jgi:hypothetical protein